MQITAILQVTMKKKRILGPIEQEFIYKHKMNDRLIRAYQITVKTTQQRESLNADKAEPSKSKKRKRAHLCELFSSHGD